MAITNTYVDINILQTVPPSNLNRDDTGSPKTAVYGGVRRSRVSSQAWKKATRDAFRESLDPASVGVRTKKVVELVSSRITAIDASLTDSAEALAEKVLLAAGIKAQKPKVDKNKEAEGVEPGAAESGYLIFFSALQLQQLAQLAVDSNASGTPVTKQAAKQAADTAHSIDLALFGRMVAEAPDLNVDASAQVAHAISVHAVDNEFDYFTAVDDESREDTAGAGMIGTVEFNSSTLYRYATVNVRGLKESLGSDHATVAAVAEFIRAFSNSMPTGKQNTFANRTLPDAVLVTVRAGQPINLSGAFEDAVRATDSQGRLEVASGRLAIQQRNSEEAFDQPALASFVVRVSDAASALDTVATKVTFGQMVEQVSALVAERLATVHSAAANG